jgi:hypothetical protein
MNGSLRISLKALAGTLLFAVALFCVNGFLASYESGFPNVFHALYGAVGTASLLGIVWLMFPGFKRA